MKLIRNGYSDRANPSRGYHDSEAILEFEADSGEDESYREGAKAAVLALYGPPANMWCSVIEFTQTRLVVKYGYDSGD